MTEDNQGKTRDLYGERMDRALRPFEAQTLNSLGISPERYDKLAWAGMLFCMAKAFREGKGELYDFFMWNLKVSFDHHGVARAFWAFHNKCLAYNEENEIKELIQELEDFLVVAKSINEKWPHIENIAVRQRVKNGKIEITKMSVEEVQKELERLKILVSTEQMKDGFNQTISNFYIEVIYGNPD